MTLYENGKKIGEISDWVLIEKPPVYKDVLGQKLLISSKQKTCKFTSPKPVRKGKLLLVDEHKNRILVQTTKVLHGTHIEGLLVEE